MKWLVVALFAAGSLWAQKPLDLVIVLEPVEWGGPAGRVLRTSEDVKLRPDDRLAVVELIGAPKVKAKLGEGKNKIGMRWRPTFHFGEATEEPDAGRRIYDALELAAKQLPDTYDPARQRAILLITADEETGSKVALGTVRAELETARVHLSVLAVPEAARAGRRRLGVSVRGLVTDLGGAFGSLEGAASVNAAIDKLRAP